MHYVRNIEIKIKTKIKQTSSSSSIVQTPQGGVFSYWRISGAGTFNVKVTAKTSTYSAVKIVQYESNVV